MSRRRGLLAEISWFQLVISALAAVTAAWIASSLGVTGTLIGAALGSFVVTISSALYGRTLEKGKTLVVQTTSGTIIQKAVQDGDIADAFVEVEEIDDSPVARAEVVTEEPTRLHWKTILVTTVIVLALALAAISTYELVSGKTLDGSSGTTIGDTLGGSKGDSGKDEKPSDDSTTPTPTPSASTPTPTPTTTTETPTPSPSTSTPTPSTDPTDPAE